jgi:hypothetical protein
MGHDGSIIPVSYLQNTLRYIVPVSVTGCVSGLARAVFLEPYSVHQKNNFEALVRIR